MSGFLDGPSLGNVTQKHVLTLMEQIQLLFCMYYIHKERSSMIACLLSKVAGVSSRNAKLCDY